MRGFSKLKNNLKYQVVEEGLIVTLLNVKKTRQGSSVKGEGGTWTPGGGIGVVPPQDTAAAFGMWLEDRRARETSTVARFRGPRLADEAFAGLRPWQTSPPPPPLTTTPPIPPPPLPFFNMARPHTWFTKLLICS